ncbi:MAG: prepilin-type N-terminal cleavage/methylation domain-containing protein [Oscillospiraceae bacterium]|nr:prepilin-type N-terminal cleavage/methylation domain-containing protein [Oscillospiraceae bacterium]MDE7279203.1 prepilin-type N-terminal cleavage/methylation domain-containing protein [Oscillospiraceae bacterium]
MKKSVKGFTLIECLIALAILGVASLTMAQIYAGVARRNMRNHLTNTSISNQIKYVEQYSNSTTDAVIVKGDDVAPGDSMGSSQYMEIFEIKNVDSNGVIELDNDRTYGYSVDVYALNTRDASDNVTTNGTVDLRYRYLVGHTN